MTFVLALTAAILSAASILLHVIAPRTKTKVDDEIVVAIDKVKGLVDGK